jgi:Domain of unknown function (DUF5122) beta-propeller
MRTKTLALWIGACAIGMARPGDLDRSFDPELRAWVTPDHVTIAADGRAWVGGGFDRGDGYSTGDLVRLGENGGVESEPAAGYLERDRDFTYREIFSPSNTPEAAGNFGYRLVKAPPATPFLLASGEFLLPTASLSWLRMSAAGEVTGKAFLDRDFGQMITPQFERDGKLWVIRESISGRRVLERRNSADGMLDPGFSQAANLPVNVTGATPGVNGSVWVTAGDGFSQYVDGLEVFPNSFIVAEQYQLFQMNGSGRQIGEKRALRSYREPRLVPGPAGSFRVVYGLDQSRAGYSPTTLYGTYMVDWFLPTGVFEKTKNFGLASPDPFLWTEAADGSYLATLYNGLTQKFSANGVMDRSFPSPGRARSVKALAGGKWLIDGRRRLNPDGSADSAWTVPDFHVPAKVTTLVPLPDGRVLAGGNFATADGIVSNRLVMFFPNGQVDPSFMPDDRIGEWRSVAVSGQAIYVVTSQVVNYGKQIRSNLVKLQMNGTLDERFDPWLPTTSWIGNHAFSVINLTGVVAGAFPVWPGGVGLPGLTPLPISLPTKVTADFSKVHTLPGGDILAETFSSGGDVGYRTIDRLRPNGWYDPGFQSIESDRNFAPILVKADGGFVISGVVYGQNGQVERDLSRPRFGLRPLCEWLGGLLFLEARETGAESRLRLWTRRGWATWFNPPTLNQVFSAVPGDFGMLYLDASLTNGTRSLIRMLPSGRVDSTFRAPAFGQRKRQFAGDWWRAEESGRAMYDPAQDEFARFPQTMIWHPASRRLWTGGDFNMVNGQPRDGLARISGGLSWRPWR